MPTVICRERVAARFAAAARYPVTLVIAPAGSGKSVALQQHLDSIAAPAIRFSVQPVHGTLLGFARGLTFALGSAAPNARSLVVDAVAAAQRAEDPGEALALWMSQQLTGFAGIVAIDDFQAADEECAQFTTSIIDLTKERIRWIISARSAERLPTSSWIIYGAADVPIGEADLRLTRNEAQNAARELHPDIEDDEIDQLLAATSGWITTFTFALRVYQRTGGAQSAAVNAREFSYSYLAEQVFRSLTEDERALLLLGSTMPCIDVPVLERAGFDRAGPILAALQRRVSFLSATPPGSGAAPRTYECHDLFRDFLRRELDLAGPAESGALRMRAARALEDSGQTVAALRIFSQAGAADDILRILRTDGFELNHSGHVDTLRLALEALPESARTSNPIALGLLGVLESLSGRYDRAVKLYQSAIAVTDDALWKANLVARLSLACLNAGNNPTEYLEPSAWDSTLPPDVQAELLSLLTMAYGRFGQFKNLNGALLDKAEALASSPQSGSKEPAVLHRLGVAAYLLGDGERATRLFRRGAELALSRDMFRLAAIIYAGLCDNLVLNEADFAEAKRSISLAAEAAAASRDAYIVRYVIGRHLECAFFGGDTVAMRALLNDYATIQGPHRPIDTVPPRAILAMWEGRFDEAYELFQQIYEDLWIQEERMLAIGCCALASAAMGKHDQAIACVRTAFTENAKPGSPRASYSRTFEFMRALCALAEALAGRRSAADRTLRAPLTSDAPAALALHAAVTAIARSIDTGIVLNDIHAHLATLESTGYGGFARIVEVIARQLDTRPIALTHTEQRILRSLAAGNAPKAIAVELGCTVHTVRWHIRRVIARFECSGSDQALRLAIARGLL